MMNNSFKYADLHCHPNLKTYGHSFDKGSVSQKVNVWYQEKPSFFSKLVNILLGISRFSQSDFTSVRKGGGKLLFVSLYPFEKGFFINAAGKGPLSAYLSDLITGIGYQRVRNLQNHLDYYKDLKAEYTFFCSSQKEMTMNNVVHSWRLVSNLEELKQSLGKEHETAVVLSIEGAHVFNSGLSHFGRTTVDEEILGNISKIKKWNHPPIFITFGHNFYNELCGHANSLEPIKHFVDQSYGLNTGFTTLGKKVLTELLSSENGKPIYIDIKHMSLAARKEYYEILNEKYKENHPPTIVSHGAVNGRSYIEDLNYDNKSSIFYPSDINFYDEEIIEIGRYNGLFAIQFDTRRISKKKYVRKSLRNLVIEEGPKRSAYLLWQQIRHIAEVLDRNNIYSWGTACIGSDYDGTIDPLPGIWTAQYFHLLHNSLLTIANEYLSNNSLIQKRNQNISSEEIVERFFHLNAVNFLKEYFDA
jgi:microsomal dipeptidase-like Zn-dependent dipeptidase